VVALPSGLEEAEIDAATLTAMRSVPAKREGR
jgi:hypothetical protein